jgi:lysozyme
MKPAVALIMTSAALLLLASANTARANVEAGEGGAGISTDNLLDNMETIMNRVTEIPANTDQATAGANLMAFLAMIRQAEGTASSPDPYAVCYGYSHTIQSYADHPAITGEWTGKRLSDTMCANAGMGPGCVSTAAGAYQIIKRTWSNLKGRLDLPDFGPASQDSAATELIRQRGALQDVLAGRFNDAVRKCRNEWASLPGNYAKQGQRNLDTLTAWYTAAGGTLA